MVAADSEGNVWLAWASFEGGKETLFASMFDGAKWTDAKETDSGKEGFLRPAMACTLDGSVWIIWPGRDERDFFRDGNYAW